VSIFFNVQLGDVKRSMKLVNQTCKDDDEMATESMAADAHDSLFGAKTSSGT